VRYLAIFLLIATTSSCQTETVTGVLKTPFVSLADTFKDWGQSLSDNTYDDIKKKTKKHRKKIADGGIDHAPDSPSPCSTVKLDEEMELISDFEKIKAKVCSCKAWGNCPNDLCACDVLCPKTFDIFWREPDQGSRNVDRLPFANSDSDFPNHKIKTGYCRGMAIVQQRFNRLAFFNPNKEFPKEVKEDPVKRKEYFDKIIGKIMDNKPVEIPHFKNLFEMSGTYEYPEIKEKLQDVVAKTWSRTSMNFHASASGIGNDGLSMKERKKFIKDIEYRLENNMRPTIDISKINGGFGDIHVTLVRKIIKKDDHTILCLDDSNGYYEPFSEANFKKAISGDFTDSEKYKCAYQIKIPTKDAKKPVSANIVRKKDDGTTTEKNRDWLSPVGGLKISHHEDRDIPEQVHNLAKYCRKKKGCAKK
jgi:hypothetical protein